jgi:acyl-CoA synthetase (AMP-forming)/AMP-acid ligase II
MGTASLHGCETRIWKHIPRSLRDLFERARSHGEATFLVLDDERVTYQAFAKATEVLAAYLEELGVRRGDRVAIVMRNLPEWPVALFAASLLGAIAVPLNAWWTGRELQGALSDCGANTVICDYERYERLAPCLDDGAALRHVVVSRASANATTFARLEDVIGTVEVWAELPVRFHTWAVCEPDDDAMILYTSGTSGTPKGAVASHRNLLSCIASMRYLAARASMRAGVALGPPVPKVLLLVIPLFHVTGCAANLLPHMYAGSKIVLMHRWDATRGLGLIAQERVTVTGGVPTVATQILECEQRPDYDLSSLEVVTYGGAPSALSLAEQISRTLGCAPGNGWGMTETSGTLTGHFGEDYVMRPSSAGPPLPVADVRIVREGCDVPIGEEGELWVRGPGVVRGYWNKPKETNEAIVDGWLCTGDVCRIDEEGFVYVVDRLKDVVIRGGENIYCIEVETVLMQHPAVRDAAVLGVSHDVLGQVPVAVVQVNNNVAEDVVALRAFLSERLAAYKIPVQIRLSVDALPRNANGKVLKKELRGLFADG